jgi:hypothetical protein
MGYDGDHHTLDLRGLTVVRDGTRALDDISLSLLFLIAGLTITTINPRRRTT